MTNTRDRLANIIGAHASQAHRYHAADAILAALPDLVKPLVWRDCLGDKRADTPFGHYIVRGQTLTINVHSGLPPTLHTDPIGAAEGDYRRRVMMSLGVEL